MLKKIELSTFKDERGVLSVIELDDYVDFPIKRVYYLPEILADRGGHAVRGEDKIYVMQKGSCLARFHDGNNWIDYELKGPNEAIIMEGFYYRNFKKFSKDAVLMALSSVVYNHDDYVYSLDEFISEKNN